MGLFFRGGGGSGRVGLGGGGGDPSGAIGVGGGLHALKAKRWLITGSPYPFLPAL